MIEYALSLLPYESVTIKTPQGVSYEGKRCSVKKICGVSILRAGETMEQALTEVCKDIRVGKILIQTSPESGEPGKTNNCYAALKNYVMTAFWELNLSFFP